MDLRAYVDFLGRELTTAAEAGGEDARALVERLAGTLEPAVRLTLLEALSAAADEITRDLAPGSVEIRLRGRDPSFVVKPPPSEPAYPVQDPVPVGTDEAATARINFRLPEHLKTSIEEAAAKQGRSVNAWLGRVVAAALRQPGAEQALEPRSGRGKQSYTGWAG